MLDLARPVRSEGRDLAEFIDDGCGGPRREGAARHEAVLRGWRVPEGGAAAPEAEASGAAAGSEDDAAPKRAARRVASSTRPVDVALAVHGRLACPACCFGCAAER